MIVLPETYPKDQCEQIKSNISSFARIVLCIPAPKLSIMKDESKVEQFGQKYKDCTMNGAALMCPLENPISACAYGADFPCKKVR